MQLRIGVFTIAAAWLWACGDGDPSGQDASITDDPVTGAACSPAPSYTEDVSGCSAAATDYMPRENASADDDWDACISDDGVYHQIEASVSSIARVEAYDAIGDLLWGAGAEPTHDAFLEARVKFEEEQGIGSRVARRYDVHYTAPAEGACDEEGVAEAHPDYCVGPATLQPIIVEAFADGALGHNRIVNAAKIHAALQWFLYVSPIKECTTCAETPKDCDSCWAYYSGGTPRDTPIGMASEIDDCAPETHDRAYDGLLAVRCWRDLDQAVPAEDTALQALAIGQLDTALVRGVSILVRQRFEELSCATGDYRQGALEALRILVPLLDRETRARDASAADTLMAEIEKNADEVDLTAAVTALDDTYPCP